jgi:ankyrin repeat protein
MISGSNFPALNLFDAIWQGSEEVINNLLSSGASVRTRDHLNQSPLHAAIMKGDISIVEALLRYGASIDDQGVGGRSSLHLGIGSKALVKLLLKYHPKESSLQDDDGNTALHLLLRQDAWWTDEDLKATIRCFVSARADINITNKFGESPLHRLVLDAQDVPSIQILLEFLNCSPNMEQPMPNGSLVFDYFLETANEIITSDGGYLLSGKINAVFLCLSRFVEAGADPNTIFHGTPLLSYCLEEYHFGMYWSSGSIFSNFLSLLVQRADLGKAGRADNPPLHSALARELREASSYGRPKFQIIKSLISKKVDVNEVGAQGSSPLEVWIRKAPGRYVIEGVQLLVAAGAVTMRMTSTGNTLFDLVDTRTGRLSKPDGVHLTKLFLEADMKSQQPLEASMSDQYWIEIWRAACKEKRWALLVCHLTRLRESPSRPSVRYFDDCAFLVLANDRLQLHQSQIKLWQAGELDQESAWRHRREYVAILRDCRERKAAIDGSWYQYLLDIMDIQ